MRGAVQETPREHGSDTQLYRGQGAASGEKGVTRK